ncbi:MAG TPA: ABC transporter ATP-binding protein [Chloroflexota bacterium]|nr:ABC transporter ATP-binding protein [Chloroflexota bacterium]
MDVPLSRYRRLLAVYLRPQWPRATALAGLLVVGIALQLLRPQIVAAFIDAAVGGAPGERLAAGAALFLGVAALGQVVAVAETYLATNVGQQATNALRADLALHCLRLDPQFHNTHTPGELIERVDGDVDLLSNFLSRFAVQVVGNVLLLGGVLVLLARVDPRFGLAFGALTVVAFAVLRTVQPIPVPYRAAARQASAALFGFLEERLSGVEDLRANGAVAYTMRRLYERMRDLLRKERKGFVLGSATGASTPIILTLATAVAFVLGAALFRAGELTLGAVFLVISYTELLRQPIEQLSREAQDLQRATAGIGRIQDLLETRSVVVDGPDGPLPDGPLPVAFEGVDFAYDADSPTLQDVTFRLQAGEVLGLIGRTGSGKTTVSRLLFRLYDPTAGAVRLGGVDLRRARLADVRRRVALVTQEVQLFQGSVRDNLTMFDPAIAEERILEALRALELGPWLATLPAGLDTVLGPGGRGPGREGGAAGLGGLGLSAGEAQLLALARAFLRAPCLVILDEASSRLDPATERRIERAVGALLRERTAIIIAHRLATVRRADRVLVMEGGRVAEQGLRVALAADPESRYAALLRSGQAELLA